jgi:MFS family permease
MNKSMKRYSKDGGWCWFVCFSCFVGHVILGGIKRSFGLALPLLKRYFETSTTSISWVASILEGMYYIVGPLVSFVANRIGLSLTCLIGSILTALGLVISTTVPNVFILILTYSVIAGTGLGFIYLPVSVACNYYFEKRIGLATGISKSGYSIGGIIFPLLANLVLSTSGWKAMFYMFSVAALVNCGCSALLNPFFHKKSFMPYQEIESNELSNSNNDNTEEENIVTAKQCRNTDNDMKIPCESISVTKVKIEILSHQISWKFNKRIQIVTN